jgi:hypothetical protein
VDWHKASLKVEIVFNRSGLVSQYLLDVALLTIAGSSTQSTLIEALAYISIGAGCDGGYAL